jgi:hypothetical protein
LSASQKADFVLPCDPQAVIFGVDGHFNLRRILFHLKFLNGIIVFLTRFGDPFSKVGNP